jgi:CubicO group peptidase (beta-lactamase class C family)
VELLPRTRAVLDAGLAARAFPAAVVEVGRAAGRIGQIAVGRLRYDADAPLCTVETIFDLASLTKVIATTSFVMRAIGAGRLALDAPVAHYLPEWRDAVHAPITSRQLLDHSSGLPAHARFWEQHRGRAAFERAIHDAGLDRPIGASAVYSDLGFMTLGFIVADVFDAPLDRQLDELTSVLDDGTLAYLPSGEWRARTAPTEFDPWRGRLLCGEVHDENAAALDGVAGHAGVFGTAAAVGAFARLVLRTFQTPTWLGTPALMQTMAAKSSVPGSSRALGWDTMLPTSSCGTRLSTAAIGHTGFTGTSLWIDPTQNLYVVLLTNRVHPTRSNDGVRAVRPRLHDAVVEDLFRTSNFEL